MHAILWTDDGPDSLPIVTAVGGVNPHIVDDFTVVIPERNFTGYGGRIDIDHKYNWRIDMSGIYHTDAYPAVFPYFVKYVLEIPLNEVMCIAVNNGWNFGSDVLNSSTVLSLLQARWLGCRYTLAVNFPKEFLPAGWIEAVWLAIEYAKNSEHLLNLNLPATHIIEETEPVFTTPEVVRYDSDVEKLLGDDDYQAGFKILDHGQLSNESLRGLRSNRPIIEDLTKAFGSLDSIS